MTEAPGEHLFSYGTLQDEKVQRAVFGRPVRGTSDAIVGYELVPVTISSRKAIAISGKAQHTTLVPTKGESDPIEGVVFHITASDLAAADRYESAEYHRIKVRLRSGVEAWVYVRV
ncbi:MAG: gamma-glutamylcyclotransferase [Proteobacteria bacterium]|nr:gamma-glutamylcyclotransferase [Pseudomonadota bacterium]